MRLKKGTLLRLRTVHLASIYIRVII